MIWTLMLLKANNKPICVSQVQMLLYKLHQKLIFHLKNEYIQADEYLEITPESLRMRKINYRSFS